MAATLLTWCGKTFSVTPTKVYSFDDMAIGGSIKTKNVDQSGIHKIDSDGLDAAEYSCSVPLDARLGVDVQSEVCHWISMQRSICRGNLIISGQDIFGVPFLLKKCKAEKIRIAGSGVWRSATMELEFVECPAGASPSVSATASSTGNGASSLLTWGGKTISVSPTKVYSFDDLEIECSLKTKDSDQSGIHKAESDGLEAASYSVSLPIDARLGVDVQSETRSWMSLMRSATKSNLQITGRDIFGVPFMLTKCEAKDVRLTGNGAWLKAVLELEFEEAAVVVASSGGSSSGGSSSKKSSKSSSSKATSYKAGDDVDVISMAAPKASSSSSSNGNLSGALGGFVSYVTSAIKSVVSTAKSNTTSTKSSSTKSTTSKK